MAENKVRVIDNLIKENVKFEDIIEELGGVRKFQIRLNVIFNFIAAIFSTMSSYAKLLALTVPEHWCHVPGREDTNLTVEMWKNLTIPRTEDGKYSRCLMKVPGQENETTPCLSGWDYDATWFSLTAASQENWVCDKQLYPSTVYSVSYFVSAAVGVLLFYIGDRFGRRKQFLIGMSATAMSQTLLPVSASVLPLYTALSAASEGAHFPMSEAMIATGIELAPIKHRSTVNFLSFVSYCLGVIAMALVAWFLKNWIYFTLVAAVPCFIPLLLQRSTAEFIIFTLLFNNSSFGANPFVAFIGKGSLQLAASYAGHIVGNRFGRRITQCLVLLSAAFFCFILVFLTTAYSSQWIITTLSLMLLFCAECSYVLTNLQSLELHPTSLRQIGIAVEYVFVQCVMTAPPYLAHLGKTTGMYTVFSILAAVALIMTILMSFVPESFHEKLPETKEDISHFGKKQKYWSLPNKSEKDHRELCY